jgi:RNA polymerase sigma-70 factor (ECF subfamily)
MVTERLLARLAPLLAVDEDTARALARGEGAGALGPDAAELHKLVVDHGEAAYRLARSIVGDAALAEDITQDALVKAWLALPSFRGEGSLRSWLLRITHNTAISALRARRAEVTDPADLPETARGDVSPEVEGRFTVAAFEEALRTLDPLSRSIVVLREIEGLAYEEIAATLRLSLPLVKTRLLRARRRLQVALEDWR